MTAPASAPTAPPVIPPATDAPTPPATDTAPPAPAADDPAATITRLEKELTAARAEAAKSRVNAKQSAADEARAELAQQIGKALGLVKDEPVDPAKLTEQLTAAGADAKQARLELAVYRVAAESGADAAALLDSRHFLAQVANIDPADSAAITAAIAATVTANPRLAAASANPTPPARVPAPNPAVGSSGSGAAVDIDQEIAAATKAGNHRRAIALKRQKAYGPQAR